MAARTPTTREMLRTAATCMQLVDGERSSGARDASWLCAVCRRLLSERRRHVRAVEDVHVGDVPELAGDAAVVGRDQRTRRRRQRARAEGALRIVFVKEASS